MYIHKENGRKTRDLNGDSMASLKIAKEALVMALTYDDPKDLKAAIAQAWAALEEIQTNMLQIEANCILAAKRGPYR